MDAEIEKGIPLPSNVVDHHSRKYPFPDMGTGDSIVGSKNTATAAHQYGKKHGWKFAVRAIGNDRFRIWRIS